MARIRQHHSKNAPVCLRTWWDENGVNTCAHTLELRPRSASSVCSKNVIIWWGDFRTRAGKADGAVRGDDDIEFGATRLADQVPACRQPSRPDQINDLLFSNAWGNAPKTRWNPASAAHFCEEVVHSLSTVPVGAGGEPAGDGGARRSGRAHSCKVVVLTLRSVRWSARMRLADS